MRLDPHKFERALDLHILAIDKVAADHNVRVAEYDKVRKQLLANSLYDKLNFEAEISYLYIDTYNRSEREFNGS